MPLTASAASVMRILVSLGAYLALAWAMLVMLFWHVALVDRMRITWRRIRR